MKTFVCSTVDCPAPDIENLPDISKVIDTSKEVAEDYARKVGFVLPAIGSAQRTAAAYDYPNRNLVDATGGTSLPASVYTYMITGAGLEWAKRTISPEIMDLRYTFSTPENSRNKLGPHCDRSRWYSLIFLLDSGGNDHYTAFYQEKGQPLLERDYGYHIDDYNKLKEIHRIVLPLNRWALINTKVLHSAENIPGTRISYHISFNTFPASLNLENPVYL